MLEGPILYSVLSAMFTGGVAYGGFKVALNGTKNRISKLEEVEERAEMERIKTHERLASLETKIDMIYDKVK
jgi:hypothetical protein